MCAAFHFAKDTLVKVILKDDIVVMLPDTVDEAAELKAWKDAHEEHVLALRGQPGNATTLELKPLGPRLEACREPINVVSYSPNEGARLISNFAQTPFHLDGRDYTSVESFWQGLKLPNEEDRRRFAAYDGARAKRKGSKRSNPVTLVYEGVEVRVGTYDHWQLMERACRAKFEQNFAAREALLSTGTRPLIHVVRRDSKTIPGVIMADIWMRIRADLQRFRA